MSLLERAKISGTPNNPSKEEIDLCMAWVNGEIKVIQVQKAIDGSPSKAYSLLARTLRYILKNSLLYK